MAKRRTTVPKVVAVTLNAADSVLLAEVKTKATTSLQNETDAEMKLAIERFIADVDAELDFRVEDTLTELYEEYGLIRVIPDEPF